MSDAAVICTQVHSVSLLRLATLMRRRGNHRCACLLAVGQHKVAVVVVGLRRCCSYSVWLVGLESISLPHSLARCIGSALLLSGFPSKTLLGWGDCSSLSRRGSCGRLGCSLSCLSGRCRRARLGGTLSCLSRRRGRSRLHTLRHHAKGHFYAQLKVSCTFILKWTPVLLLALSAAMQAVLEGH